MTKKTWQTFFAVLRMVIPVINPRNFFESYLKFKFSNLIFIKKSQFFNVLEELLTLSRQNPKKSRVAKSSVTDAWELTCWNRPWCCKQKRPPWVAISTKKNCPNCFSNRKNYKFHRITSVFLKFLQKIKPVILITYLTWLGVSSLILSASKLALVFWIENY